MVKNVLGGPFGKMEPVTLRPAVHAALESGRERVWLPVCTADNEFSCQISRRLRQPSNGLSAQDMEMRAAQGVFPKPLGLKSPRSVSEGHFPPDVRPCPSRAPWGGQGGAGGPAPDSAHWAGGLACRCCRSRSQRVGERCWWTTASVSRARRSGNRTLPAVRTSAKQQTPPEARVNTHQH